MDLGTHVARQLEEARSVSIEGVILDSHVEGALIIVPCFCVQDSPENPCPCKDWIKWIVGRRDVLGEPERTDRKSSSGEPIFKVRIGTEAKVIVEKGVSMSAGSAAAMTTSQSARASFPQPSPFPWPWPCSPGPTFPDSGDGEPGVVYFLPWGQIIRKWGPAVIGAVGGAIGGWLSSGDEDCTTKSTQTETVNADGSKTIRTVSETTCK